VKSPAGARIHGTHSRRRDDRAARGGRRNGRWPSTLMDRRFEAIVFDWDGTAVPERWADA
jgi:hypothetical protein